MVAPPPSPLPALLAGGVERVAVRLDAEDDERLAAGRLPLLQQRPARQVGGHPHRARLLRAPAPAARRARRRLPPCRHAVPHQLARPESEKTALSFQLKSGSRLREITSQFQMELREGLTQPKNDFLAALSTFNRLQPFTEQCSALGLSQKIWK